MLIDKSTFHASILDDVGAHATAAEHLSAPEYAIACCACQTPRIAAPAG